MIRRFFSSSIAVALIAWAAMPGVAAQEASIDWVSYCRGELQKATVVRATKARKLSKAKAPFCVAYEEGFYDPLELSNACDEAAPKTPPWASSKSVDLLMTLPAAANAADYEVTVQVTAPEMPLGCAGCDPGPQCEGQTREVTKEFRLTFSKSGERKIWSLIKAMQPPQGREYESMKATAVVKRKGAEILQRVINVTWSLCC